VHRVRGANDLLQRLGGTMPRLTSTVSARMKRVGIRITSEVYRYSSCLTRSRSRSHHSRPCSAQSSQPTLTRRRFGPFGPRRAMSELCPQAAEQIVRSNRVPRRSAHRCSRPRSCLVGDDHSDFRGICAVRIGNGVECTMTGALVSHLFALGLLID